MPVDDKTQLAIYREFAADVKRVENSPAPRAEISHALRKLGEQMEKAKERSRK